MIHSSSSRLLAADAPRESRGGRIRNAFAVGRTRWGMLALVFFATTLNYIDRAALGVMQPILAEKMSWTAMDYANINFWFQVGYAIGFILQGRFIDKVGVKRAFFLAVLLWSLATGAHGLATSAAGFMVCRFILGLTEAANYPACVKTTRLWFPAGERAVATGIFNAGTNVGAMVTPALLPLILGVWGWQAAFLCMSALGLVWLVFWWRNYYNPEEHPRVKQSELEYIQQQEEPPATRVPFSQILRRRGTWAFALAYSITAPVFWFYLYWLPPFLNQQYGLGISVTQMGIPLILTRLAAGRQPMEPAQSAAAPRRTRRRRSLGRLRRHPPAHQRGHAAPARARLTVREKGGTPPAHRASTVQRDAEEAPDGYRLPDPRAAGPVAPGGCLGHQQRAPQRQLRQSQARLVAADPAPARARPGPLGLDRPPWLAPGDLAGTQQVNPTGDCP